MKKKTANKVLSGKFRHWVNSITADDVKKVVKENAIITGGSIASLLTNEKVNDYDVYFRTQKAAYKVANYYASQFNTLEETTAKVQNVTSSEDRVKVIVPSAGIAKVGKSSDYEFFETIENENEQARRVENYVGDVTDIADSLEEGEKLENYTPVFVSANAITLTNDIQLVFRFFGEPEDLHKNFDFVHCTGYWTSWNKQVKASKQCLESLLSKHLHFQSSKYPICAMIRTRKFINRGWHINAGEYLKIAFSISELDLTNPEVLEEQLTGVDQYYFMQIINAIKKKKKEDENFEVNYTYLATLIDKIF